MHASFDISTCEPLKLFASLNEEAARRNLDCNSPAIPQPDKQARKARFAMDREEIEVVVVASIAHV